MSADPSAMNRMPGFITHAHLHGAAVQVVDDSAIADYPPPSIACNVQLQRIELLIDRLLNLRPRPTGIFVPSDYITAIAQPMLQKRGIEIGRDMLLVSCNNDALALAMLDPRPATIDLNSKEIGRQAAQVMGRRIAGETSFPWANVLVPPKLIDSP